MRDSVRLTHFLGAHCETLPRINSLAWFSRARPMQSETREYIGNFRPRWSKAERRPFFRFSAARMKRAFCHGLLAVFLLGTIGVSDTAAQDDQFVPVTDAMLQNPPPDDWLMWRRTLDGWGYSPLDQITRDNVSDLRLVWTRALGPGAQEGTPLAFDGWLYMPNPNEHVQAMDAVTGDLLWEYRRDIPEDVPAVMGGLTENNRNIARYGNLIIDTANDDYV